MSGQPIKKFITYKEPITFECHDGLGGIIFRSHVIMSDDQHLLISDTQRGKGFERIDETLVFMCDENGEVSGWSQVAGGRYLRTDEIVKSLNEEGYYPPELPAY